MLKRTLKLFFILFCFAVFGVWISNNYGTVEINWLGYSIETSVPILIITLWFMLFVISKVIWLLSLLMKPFKKEKKEKISKKDKKLKNKIEEKVIEEKVIEETVAGLL